MLLKLNEFISFLQLDKVKLSSCQDGGLEMTDLVDIQILIKDKKKKKDSFFDESIE